LEQPFLDYVRYDNYQKKATKMHLRKRALCVLIRCTKCLIMA